MSDEERAREVARQVYDMAERVSVARTQWLLRLGEVSKQILIDGIEVGAALGDISWDEAIAGLRAQAGDRIESMMRTKAPHELPAWDADVPTWNNR